MAKDLQPLPKSEWTRAAARHLLNRAGFGVPHSRIDVLHALGPAAAVDGFVNYDQFADNLRAPEFIPRMVSRDEMNRMSAGLTEDEQREAQQETRRLERESVQNLEAWWLQQMRESSRPLQEKMALFWHGHFAVSAEKVQPCKLNADLNALFRSQAAGNFKQLALAVGQTPAMLIYLDNNVNRKGRPNENWARELMELFTLGIGNYTEEDIRESARAFTGWTNIQDQFVNLKRQHDEGEKTFLGRKGNFKGEDIIDIIFEQPACARFLCRKLWLFFANETPDDQVIEGLARTLRESNYELKPVLRQLFSSRAFYAPDVVNSQIKSPVQLIVGLWDALSPRPDDFTMLRLAMDVMGQRLFYPPNVKGWEGNRTWINTTSLLVRYNLSAYLLHGLQLHRGKSRQAPVDITPFFADLDGQPLGRVVDTVIDRMLSVPVDAKQRLLLLKTLMPEGREDTTFTASAVPEARRQAIVHLLLSTAESQLC